MDAHIPMEPPGCEQLCEQHKKLVARIEELGQALTDTRIAMAIQARAAYNQGFDEGYESACYDFGMDQK